MSIIKAIILGIVQGLCEFLPVSSSGHLTILQKAFNISENGSLFIIMVHLGTLIAVFIVYWKQILAILKKPFQKKTYLLLVSTLATVILYFLLGDMFDSLEGNGIAIGCSFLFTAIILLLTDFVVPKIKFKNKKDGSIESTSYLSAAGIGLIQGIAILPGVSRSGSTIAGSRFFGLNKESAAEYSFLLSIPAILGGLVTEIPDLAKTGVSSVDWLPILIGTVAAAISGYFAITFMLQLITKRKLWGFSIYVGILGLFLILDTTFFGIIF